MGRGPRVDVEVAVSVVDRVIVERGVVVVVE